MKIQKVVEIDISTDNIIEEHKLTANSSVWEISKAIDDYVDGLDDCEYYLIDIEDKDKILSFIADQLSLNF